MEVHTQRSFEKCKKNKSSELCGKPSTDDVTQDSYILSAAAAPFRSRMDIPTFASQLSCGAGISNNKCIPKVLFSYKYIHLNKQHTDNSFLAQAVQHLFVWLVFFCPSGLLYSWDKQNCHP